MSDGYAEDDVRHWGEVLHRILDANDDNWHYSCSLDRPVECFKGAEARRMLTDAVVPEFFAALDKAGRLVRETNQEEGRAA